MRVLVYFLLAILFTANAESYQHSQVVENLRGPLGSAVVTWTTSTEEYTGSYQYPDSVFSLLFSNIRLENLDKAYGKLLEELDIEYDPNIKSNKIRFLDHLGSLGWKLLWIRELEGKTIYQFERPVSE